MIITQQAHNMSLQHSRVTTANATRSSHTTVSLSLIWAGLGKITENVI